MTHVAVLIRGFSVFFSTPEEKDKILSDRSPCDENIWSNSIKAVWERLVTTEHQQCLQHLQKELKEKESIALFPINNLIFFFLLI